MVTCLFGHIGRELIHALQPFLCSLQLVWWPSWLTSHKWRRPFVGSGFLTACNNLPSCCWSVWQSLGLRGQNSAANHQKQTTYLPILSSCKERITDRNCLNILQWWWPVPNHWSSSATHRLRKLFWGFFVAVKQKKNKTVLPHGCSFHPVQQHTDIANLIYNFIRVCVCVCLSVCLSVCLCKSEVCQHLCTDCHQTSHMH